MNRHENGITDEGTAPASAPREAMANGADAGSTPGAYRTGHCRPPREHCFKPGQSGNPAGRPRRAATGAPGDRLPGAHEPTRQVILEEAYRLITVRDGDDEVTMPMNQAVFRAMGKAALAGSRIAQRHWARMVREAEAEQRRDQIAVHNAVVWPVGDSRDLTGRSATADYADEIITDRRSKVTVVKAVEEVTCPPSPSGQKRVSNADRIARPRR